ncbi:histidine kinase [Nocardiopsis sp. RSe5-2]|uniref:histidine kinase n=1 Tax=Nocardiopsis endophytica TaxID=3018445 RepID=A0ABT4TWS7_9ACTN|nr:histidine kinase [Nocardiopsis endophytica]MDA2809146.1 histidine kinase [Nocardiopsis endophytica]
MGTVGRLLRDAHGARVPELRHWTFIAAAVVLFALTVQVYIVALGRPVLVAVPLALLVALPAVLCRYRPMASWWLVLVGATVSGPFGLPPWYLNSIGAHLPVFFVIGLSLPLRTALPALPATVLAGAVGGLFLPDFPEPPEQYMTGVAAWAMALTLALALGYIKRVRRDAALRLAEERRRVAEEHGMRRLLEERARIARELHDIVAHHMSIIAVQSATAPYRIDGGVAEDVAREFTSINTAARDSLGEMRRLLSVLRAPRDGPGAAPQPGLGDLPGLVASTRRSGLPVSLEGDGLPDGPPEGLPEGVPAAVSLSAYRIVQEALSNVVRHATGAPTTVRVDAGEGGALVIEVRNAAAPEQNPEQRPEAAPPGSGHGLAGMRERAGMLGGALTAGPDDDGGFLVRATLPLAPGRDGRDEEDARGDDGADRR